MPRVVLSAQARADVSRLHQFLATKNPPLAARAIAAIEAYFRPLETMPHIGRPVQSGLRELVIAFGSSGYLALYHVDEPHDELVILAIKHQLEDDYSGGIA